MTTLRFRRSPVIRVFAICFIRIAPLLVALVFAAPSGVYAAQSVALVNGEPISSLDLEERQKLMAATEGLGDAIQKEFKAVVSAPDIQQRFREFVMRKGVQPRTQEEVKELQQEFVREIQIGIQKRLLAARRSAMRDKALEALIEERLMLQDAKANKIVVSDDDVTNSLTRKSADGKVERSPEDLFKQLRGMNIDPKTFIEKKKAELSWVQLIRRLYGHRIQSVAAAAAPSQVTKAGTTLYDVRIVKISLPANADQRAIGRAWAAADGLRQRFSSCDKLNALVRSIEGAQVETVSRAELGKFAHDARSMIVKAGTGQMTPPIVVRNAIEAYAVCQQHLQKAKSDGNDEDRSSAAANKRQQEFEIYARRHLMDLKSKADVECRLTPKPAIDICRGR